ncbi:hypothetical protein GGR54DRAFT_638793 [Hypoxylon sp. NC1633]|nr:hypothetical protein GGR54DRAFT_638793 [Hypoxylon sp. NC1633]
MFVNNERDTAESQVAKLQPLQAQLDEANQARSAAETEAERLTSDLSSPMDEANKKLCEAEKLCQTQTSEIKKLGLVHKSQMDELIRTQNARVDSQQSFGGHNGTIDHDHDQTRKNQTITIADMGFDTGDASDTYPAFIGRVETLVSVGRKEETNDPVGHGTHDCGSLLGNGFCETMGSTKGMAPGLVLSCRLC